MKRLFRTSKSEVNPLPSPSLPSDHAAQVHSNSGSGVNVKKSSSALKLQGGDGNGVGHLDHMLRFGSKTPSQGSVTPFPMDVGREQAGIGLGHHQQQQQQQQQQQHQHQHQHQHQPSAAPQRRLSRREKKAAAAAAAATTTTVPSLLEMRTKQEESRRSPLTVVPQGQVQSQTRSRGYDSDMSSPDGWVNVPTSASRPANVGPDANANRPPSLAAPAPPAVAVSPSPRQAPSGATPAPTAQQLYLPPGARPPTPPPSVRAGTPTRLVYPSNLGQSQSSLHSAGYDAELYNAQPRVNRDRGYSSASASARGSDHESSLGHASVPHGAASKPSKGPAPHQTTRSPLVNTYASPPQQSYPAPAAAFSPPPQAFPTPQPHPYNQSPVYPNPYSPLSEDMNALQIEQRPREESDAGPREKKKFWDMGWAGKKDRDKDKDKDKAKNSEARYDDGRRSVDIWSREVENVPQQSFEEERGRAYERGRMDDRARVLAVDPGQNDAAAARDVQTAIQLLCTHPDPSFGAIYAVCDRINLSENPESVSKEAARAIRKQFKHGNEAERKNAARVWLFMMKNIHAASFRPNKKMTACLEPILLAPPTKPLVSAPTHTAITDILADLTYNYGQEKGCESLVELWKKVKLPQEPEQGKPLPADNQTFQPEAMYPTRLFDGPYGTPPVSRTGSSPSVGHMLSGPPPPIPSRGRSPERFGPGYAHLPSHNDDMRRLTDECIAAKESARVLSEALVYTRPDELELKPVIREFYNKCFHAHESLTGQIEWAQAEAARSRDRVMNNALTLEANETQPHEATVEEQALATLFDAHGALAEALKQHDELENLAADEKELREVRERSKKETRMDRNNLDVTGGFLSAPKASGSRSPSPSAARLGASPRDDLAPLPSIKREGFSYLRPNGDDRSRTPSPDRHPLPHPPKLSSSPARAGSPLGRVRIPGPRPLPNPFKLANGSSQSLGSVQRDHHNPSRSGTGSTNESSAAVNADAEVEEDDAAKPAKPSRKALGKRRAVVDEDNNFDPDDLFGMGGKKDESSESDESLLADDVYTSKPVQYAYDAYQDKLDRLRRGEVVPDATDAGVESGPDRARVAGVTGVGASGVGGSGGSGGPGDDADGGGGGAGVGGGGLLNGIKEVLAARG